MWETTLTAEEIARDAFTSADSFPRLVEESKSGCANPSDISFWESTLILEAFQLIEDEFLASKNLENKAKEVVLDWIENKKYGNL